MKKSIQKSDYELRRLHGGKYDGRKISAVANFDSKYVVGQAMKDSSKIPIDALIKALKKSGACKK